jgi:hypothetical protein
MIHGGYASSIAASRSAERSGICFSTSIQSARGEHSAMNRPYRCIVMGAAGRDFHVFLSFLRGNERFRVVAFTATQIPFIDTRSFPQSLAGPGYEADIPIHDESELVSLIREQVVDFVFFAYSDIAHAEVMHKASLVQAAGASFVMLGPEHTQIASDRPVASITATRTGADRGGQEPADPVAGAHVAGAGQTGRGDPPPDAVRQPLDAARAALRDPRGPR